MKKEAFYFPHYINARNDRKLRRLRKELGVEGYGIYFMLLEVLREEPGFKYPICDIDLLAEDFNTSDQKVETVITKYDLFVVLDDSFFMSEKLIQYLQPYIEKSERARDAANKRWNKYKSNANALPEHSGSNAKNGMVCNVNKVKESKVNNTSEDEFNLVWFIYPKKTYMMDAKEQFSQLLPSSIQQIKTHLPLFIQNHAQNKKNKYLPRLDQYLAKRRWEDGQMPYSENESEPVRTFKTMME